MIGASVPAREPSAPVPEAPAPAAQDGGRRSLAAAARAAPPGAAATLHAPLDPVRSHAAAPAGPDGARAEAADVGGKRAHYWVVEKR